MAGADPLRHPLTLLKGIPFSATLLLILGVLKIIAKQTKWAVDDKIITFLFEFVKNPRGKHTNPLEEKEEKTDEIIES